VDRKACKDQVVELVPVDSQELLGLQGLLVYLEHPVSMVELVPLEHLERRVRQDLLVLLVQVVLSVPRVLLVRVAALV